ncbi:MAG TPA: methyltransferase domain-containing protein [Terriglobales bacterium]|nr:methyltransferase domain-containing protein [Terriglobales bacterium]
MSHRVCPWWLGYFLASPVRRWLMKPDPIVSPYLRQGMTVLEPGPGMGFFTLPMAQMVGESGHVIAIDVQPKMINRLKRRANKAGLLNRIDARVSPANSLVTNGVTGKVDFTLAFAMVHELPDGHPFFREVAAASKPGALLLLAEPAGHVKPEQFAAELKRASDAGFMLAGRPIIKRSHAALLRRA